MQSWDGTYQSLADVPQELRVLFEERDGRIVQRPVSELTTDAELAALEQLRARHAVALARVGPKPPRRRQGRFR